MTRASERPRSARPTIHEVDGELGARLMLDRLVEEVGPQARHVRLEPELAARGSTAPPGRDP